MAEACMTFTFKVNPSLNHGAVEVFNQGGEPWFWSVGAGGDIMGAGDADLTGAELVSVVRSCGGVNTMLWGEEK